MKNVQTMKHLLAFEFDRKLKPSHAVEVPQVHGFCDGGEKAYGAVIFFRSKVKEWKLQVRPCPDEVLRCPVEKEDDPETGAHAL